jgi:hypothetical protein
VELLDGLLADAGLLGAGTSAGEAVARHREHRATWYAALMGPLLVPDDRLAEVGRAAGPEPVEVRVLVGGGAGGLLALGRRTVAGISVVGAVSALRDLDDLAGSAGRVIAAAEAMEEPVPVLVELPDAPGWLTAAELVESAGLAAQVRAGRSATALAEQLAALVEADLPFSVAGPLPGPLTGLLLAVDALVETGDAGQAAALLTGDDLPPGGSEGVRPGIDTALRGLSGTRVRRRLLSVDCPDLAAAAAQLGAGVSGTGPAEPPPGTPPR